VSLRLGAKELLSPQVAEHWRLYAVSDLHVDYPDNRKWVESLPEHGHEGDAVILAGDISHAVETVRWALQEFRRRFARVFYCVGNHELWVTRADAKKDGARVFADSCEKFQHLMAVARGLGVCTEPTRVGDGDGALWVVPLKSWYELEFGQPSKPVQNLAEKTWTDFFQVVWPAEVGSAADDASRYFDGLNAAAPAGGYDAPVVSFSHFLPRIELFPPSLPQFASVEAKVIRAALGTKSLEERIRSIDSKLHVFGHSHVNWYTHWNGIHYVQNALRYPQERKGGPSRVDVSFGMEDPMVPFMLWRAADPENFCLQPERCGRGCPRALSTSVYYSNQDSQTAAKSWFMSVKDVESLHVRRAAADDLSAAKDHLSLDAATGSAWLEDPQRHVLVAETTAGQQRPWGAGIAAVVSLQRLSSQEGWVSGLHVREAARREGVASMVLRDAERYAGALPEGPLAELRLAVSAGNPDMLRLCEHLQLSGRARFALVECPERPPRPQLQHGERLEQLTWEGCGAIMHVATAVAGTVAHLYWPCAGHCQHLSESRLREHAEQGHVVGLRGGGEQKLQGMMILVPGAPEAGGAGARHLAFAAAEGEGSLAALLALAWDCDAPACGEGGSAISGHLPLVVCAAISRGSVPGWRRPRRAADEVIFAWGVGHLTGAGKDADADT